MKTVKRCRFAGVSYNIWATQCDHPAKGDRLIDFESKATLPACGVHMNARYANEYIPSAHSLREAPVQETMTR